MNQTIAGQRLRNHSLLPARHRSAAAVVEWLGAVQAQEQPAKWGLSLRMTAAADATIERDVDAGKILRTHLMRPTWHFVTPADIRWMLELTGARVQRAMSSYNRQLELDAATLTRGTTIIERALGRSPVPDADPSLESGCRRRDSRWRARGSPTSRCTRNRKG